MSSYVEKQIDQFKLLYLNACHDLRIDPIYSLLDSLKTLVLAPAPDKLDLSSHNLGAKVSEVKIYTDKVGKFCNLRSFKRRYHLQKCGYE
jgi:hypothetical protein